MKYIVTLSLFFFLNPIFTQYSKSELQEICKVWGIIKYKTNSSQEIDLELISILENKLTLDEFVSKRNIKGITSTKSDSLLFKDSKLLGVSSKAFLSELLDKKNPKNYSFNTIKRNNEGYIILKEKIYEKDLNNNYKLLGVFRLWNYLHYFFLKPNTKEKLKINLANSLEFILKDKELAYENALYVLYSNLNDNHSVCYYKEKEMQAEYIDARIFNVNFNNVLPFKTFMHNDKFIIFETLADSLNINIYDTILKINNKDPNLFFNEHFSFFSLKKADSLFIKLNSKNIVLTKKDLIFYGKYIYSNNKISTLKNYFHLSTINKKSIQTLNNIVKLNENVVIDCRSYPKNGIANKFFNKLSSTSKRTLLYSFHIPKKQYIPNYRMVKVLNSKKEKYSGTISLLINNTTQSWAEFLVLDLCHNENVEIIGQYSANAIGQVEYTLPLPGNFYFRTTSQFGIPTTGKYNFEKGIIPDVFVNDWELEEYLLNKKSQ